MILNILAILLIVKLFFLCTRKNVTVINKIMIILILTYFPHFVLFFTYYCNIFYFLIFILSSYLWIKIIWNINRYLRVDNIKDKSLDILINGRNLSIYLMISMVLQLFFLTILFLGVLIYQPSNMTFFVIFSIDFTICLTIMYVTFVSAILRMLWTAKRLPKNHLIFCACFVFVPIANILPALYLIKYATDAYEYEMNIRSDSIIVRSEKCKTKYPILFLHGLCWRDHKKSNYWGRIPNRLIQNGAKVYYGQHDSTKSIEYSAYQIKRKINSILKNGPYQKVNIIAHSKGGLDARYMISKLGMEDKVASLTTISTPHFGSEFSDFIYQMPKPFYKLFCLVGNLYSKCIGSKAPDMEAGVYQTTTMFCKEFNQEVIDKKKVFYQSYFSTMKNPFSDIIMTIPYCIMRLKTKEKIDGLCSITSAKWGEFHIIKKEKGYRGISHADIIDLRRGKMKKFDITDSYIQMLVNLKKKGY